MTGGEGDSGCGVFCGHGNHAQDNTCSRLSKN